MKKLSTNSKKPSGFSTVKIQVTYSYTSGEIDARELKAIMKAFGMEVKKQDVRDIYAELGKEIKEGLNFNEFLGVMTGRMVNILLILGTKRLKGRNL